MKVPHIVSYMLLLCIMNTCLPAQSGSSNGSSSPAASSSTGPAAPLFNLSTGLLFQRSSPAASSTTRFPELRRRPFTKEDLFAKISTCSVTAGHEPALSPSTCSVFDEQRGHLVAELLDIERNIKKNVINIHDLATDELRRYYTMVQEVKAPELAELKTMLEQELIKYERYGSNAGMFASFFTAENINHEDRIAILHTYDKAVKNAIENYHAESAPNMGDEDAFVLEPAEILQLVFGQAETAEYIENVRRAYARVARPEYQGTTVVVDISDSVRQQPEGNTCGYHALFNADTMYAWLTRKTTERQALQKLAEGPDVAVCKDAMAELSSTSASQNYENIFDDEIEKLIQSSLFGLAAEHITIIASVDQFQEAFFGGLGSVFGEIYNKVPTIVKQLNDSPGFTHAFIVGTAGAEGVGHWFVAVVHHATDGIKLYVADSQANKDYGRAYCARSDKIQILLNVLNADPETLTQALSQ